MTAHPDDTPTHPLRPHDDADPPPPRREQLPLPRRTQQRHLEPQLRVPGGRGTGTPFSAFAADGPDRPAEITGDRAAAFQEGAARGRGPAGAHPAGAHPAGTEQSRDGDGHRPVD